MRSTDVLLSIPGILLAIGIVAWLDRGLWQLMLAIAVTYAPIFARLLRGSLLALRESDYVIAARLGRIRRARPEPAHDAQRADAAHRAGDARARDGDHRHRGPRLPWLGPPDPRTPEWGTMLTDARRFLATAPWLVFFPGLAIVISAIGFNLLGDGMRESLDPRLKR